MTPPSHLKTFEFSFENHVFDIAMRELIAIAILGWPLQIKVD